jgi:hypothetical protein
MVIFKGVRKRPEFEGGFSPGSAVEVSDLGYVNEVLFLLWLRNFKKYKAAGIVLLILGNHGSL